jgi:hypothetical protein
LEEKKKKLLEVLMKTIPQKDSQKNERTQKYENPERISEFYIPENPAERFPEQKRRMISQIFPEIPGRFMGATEHQNAWDFFIEKLRPRRPQ